MKQPRSFKEPVTGEQLFGDNLPDGDLCNAEVYSADEATIFEIMRWGKRLVEGGPPVDRQLFAKLHVEMNNSSEARERLLELTKHVNWFRTSYALKMIQDQASAAKKVDHPN